MVIIVYGQMVNPLMNRQKSWDKLALVVLLLLELWAFSGAFNKYFNLDSIFYVIHAPRSWQEAQRVLLAPDESRQYRPLTICLMGLVVPHFGLDPRPYHWIPVIFHLLNTILFYLLARRILPGPLSVIAATAFWGLHSVAAWITYDTTCLSDFMLAALLLGALILAVDSKVKKSPLLIAGSLVLFILSLLTKESATTIPLALLLSLVLADLRSSGKTPTGKNLWEACRKAVPLTGLFLGMALAYAGLLIYWFRAGRLYTQGTNAAYDINPIGHLLGKAKYFYWAVNLPDALHIPGGYVIRIAILGMMGVLSLVLLIDIVMRKGRLVPVEWAGLLWLVGMNVPALMLSHRLAKWYLYVPVMGVAFIFGTLIQNVSRGFLRRGVRLPDPAIAAMAVVPFFFCSLMQTRSYLNYSDAAYASNILQSCFGEFRKTYPSIPARLTLFMLPGLGKDDSEVLEAFSKLLSSPPVNQGQLFGLYYPGSRVQTLFAHFGHQLRSDYYATSAVWVFQYLNGHFYNVTDYYKSGGKVTLYLLPTLEREIPPLFQTEPVGGRLLYEKHLRLLSADRGDQLPVDYFMRPDLWILQYFIGHYYDVTAYYKGRHRDSAQRVIRNLEDVRATVSRTEYYPDYERFATPNGRAIFFLSQEKEIFSQVGGSTATVPVGVIPPGSFLHFEVSWMYDLGDGGWAELILRAEKKDTVIYQEYMPPNPKGEGMHWKELRIPLTSFENKESELVLKCYNDPGKNTVADWLNWRDITIETTQAGSDGAKSSTK